MSDTSASGETGSDYSLQACVARLEQAGRLARVHTPVDLALELAGVAKAHEGGKVVLFERVRGSEFPVLAGLYWNRSNVAYLLGCEEPQLPFVLEEAVARWLREGLAPVTVSRAPVQEVVALAPDWAGQDLASLPIPVHAPGDGGAYLCSSVVIARDPDTGVRNASVHRFMVAGTDRLRMLLDAGRHLRDYYERAEAQGKPLEITINNGVDPTVLLAATTSSSAAPIDRDELGIVSALRNEPLALVPGRTVEVEAIADAQFVIEGEMLPTIREPEGPFIELTGYYAERADRWVVRVKAITRRAKPIYHTMIPGRESYVPVGITADAGLLGLISRQVRGVRDIHLTDGGCGYYHAVVQMEPAAPGAAKQAIMAAFAAFPPLTMVSVVDPDVDIRDAVDVEWALTTRFDPAKDLVLVPGASGHELNLMVKDRLITKIGFDATAPFPRSAAFERAVLKRVDLSAYDIS